MIVVSKKFLSNLILASASPRRKKLLGEAGYHFKVVPSDINESSYAVDNRVPGEYAEKLKGDAKDVEIVWEAVKEISDYFRFVIQSHWLILGMKSIEVQKEGKRVKIDTGVLEIKLRAILVKDYEHRWENRPIWKFLRGIYDKYIIRTRIEQYEQKLLEEINEYIAQCKSLLAIEPKRETRRETRY